MNWYKKAQQNKFAGEEWSWRRFFTSFGLSTVLGVAGLIGGNIDDVQRLFAQDPEHVVQMAQSYQQQETSSLPSPQNDSSPTPTITNRGTDLYDMIRRHEGSENTVYPDSEGIPTVGVGFNLTRPDAESRLRGVGADLRAVLNGSPLSDDQINALFTEDVRQAQEDASSFLPNFSQQPPVVQDILTDMAFNLGLTRLNEFENMRQALLNSDYQRAAEEMVDSRWYHQVGHRSRDLVRMMQNVTP